MEVLTTKDGRRVCVRPIAKTDGPLIVEMFESLSARSRHLRFLRDIREMPQELLHRLLHVERGSSYALVAVSLDGDAEAIVAVARYGRSVGEGPVDLALAVRDDWQNAGLGKAMLTKIIAAANEHGHRRFGGLMDFDNKVMRHILATLDVEVEYTVDNGICSVRIMT